MQFGCEDATIVVVFCKRKNIFPIFDVLSLGISYIVHSLVFSGQVALSSDLSCGSVVRNLTSEYFDDPSTAMRKGASLYAVNAKFGTTSINGVATTPFEIVRVDRDAGDGACLAD